MPHKDLKATRWTARLSSNVADRAASSSPHERDQILDLLETEGIVQDSVYSVVSL